ncbi:monocarboxylate transporter 9 isoform X2 [Rhipicephalus sanguineus]|uniref:monocarboxylate transporter 9 isoform X2 n=1 Tax=Rhipicephalus sanguineus TaxID=34632 RepID=UPI00189449F3|nr:monocarboxylate transporter 9 isoform X2 [Rhipicephalus sanguineus]
MLKASTSAHAHVVAVPCSFCRPTCSSVTNDVLTTLFSKSPIEWPLRPSVKHQRSSFAERSSNRAATSGYLSQGRMEDGQKKDATAVGKPRIVKVDLYEEPHEATGEGFCKAPRLSFVECSCPDASVLGRQKKGGEAAGIDKCWWVVGLAFVMTTMESATSRCSGFLYVGIIEQMHVDRGLASWPVNLVTSVNDFGGFGVGVVATMLQVIISMYFKRYRGTAHGIMFAGSTAGAFFYPQLLLFLRSTYGFRGSLLIFGAILLHMFAFSLALREPSWVSTERLEKKRPTVASLPTFPATELEARGPSKLRRASCPAFVMESRRSIEASPSSFPARKVEAQRPAEVGRPSLLAAQLERDTTTVAVSTSQAVLQSVREVFRCTMFYALIVTWLVLSYNVDIFFSTIVDLALDKGVSMRDAVALIPYYSITDLVGRVFLPLLADRKYVRRTNLMVINYLLLGATVVSLPFTDSYGALVGASLCIAMFIGCGMTMHSVLMADYLGLERLAVGYSIMGAICGPLLMGKPPVVGFFRDNLGSYDAMFWLLGSLCVLIGLLWMMVSWFERKKVRNWELDIARNMPCTFHM